MQPIVANLEDDYILWDKEQQGTKLTVEIDHYMPLFYPYY